MKNSLPLLSAFLVLSQSLFAQISTPETNPKNILLINNVEIFNGKEEKTLIGNVLIINNLISKISTSSIVIDKSANIKIIDGKGKFLMPGLIDNHVHLALNTTSQMELLDTSLTAEKLDALTRNEGMKMLLRGFTSIRDVG